MIILADLELELPPEATAVARPDLGKVLVRGRGADGKDWQAALDMALPLEDALMVVWREQLLSEHRVRVTQARDDHNVELRKLVAIRTARFDALKEQLGVSLAGKRAEIADRLRARGDHGQ
jgi:hypothetical protein